MGTIPLVLVLVNAFLTLAPAQQNDKIDPSLLIDLFGTPPPSNDSHRNPWNDSDKTTAVGCSLPTTAPTVTTENKKESEDANCQCVLFYQCRNGSILTTGETLLDIRFKDECGHYTSKCCKLPNVIPEMDVVKPTQPDSKGCGVRHPNGVGYRVIGNEDSEALLGEFPWMVAIITPGIKDTKLIFHCGGSLIHKQAVLTAAHCVRGKKPHDLKVRAGEWDTQTNNEILPHQDCSVKTIIVHEKFHAGGLFYDFAILILSEPVEIAENVNIVCLPEKIVDFDESRCFASGWGQDKFSAEGQYQVILKKVELPIVPHGTCQNTLRKTRLGKYFDLHDSFICAGGESDKDTCKGDGGSPLVCPSKKDPTRYQQAGIVAWGIGCGEGGIPGIYANVAYARDWIDKQMVSNNLNTTVYKL